MPMLVVAAGSLAAELFALLPVLCVVSPACSGICECGMRVECTVSSWAQYMPSRHHGSGHEWLGPDGGAALLLLPVGRGAPLRVACGHVMP